MTNPEQLLDDALRDARNEALEEAARVCESLRPVSREEAPQHWAFYEATWGALDRKALECAGAIRALKSQEAK